jgi:hypothetical protein
MGDSSAGSGLLDIREIQVSGSYSAVLQVVQEGYAQAIQLSDGTPAVYLDGQWESTGSGHIWQTGVQAKLLFERNGVLFWITGDPRDGVDEDALVAIGNELTPATASLTRYLAASAQDVFSGELYEIVPANVSPGSGVGLFVLMQPSSGSPLS